MFKVQKKTYGLFCHFSYSTKLGKKETTTTLLLHWKPQMGPHDAFDHVICLHAGWPYSGEYSLGGSFFKVSGHRASPWSLILRRVTSEEEERSVTQHKVPVEKWWRVSRKKIGEAFQTMKNCLCGGKNFFFLIRCPPIMLELFFFGRWRLFKKK